MLQGLWLQSLRIKACLFCVNNPVLKWILMLEDISQNAS